MENIDLNILAFYMFAGLSVSGALAILFTRNIVHAVFMLVLVFVGIAAIFMVSHAEFVGVTQILIYVGGILILMIFGVMLTQRIDGSRMLTQHKHMIHAGIVGVMLMGMFHQLLNEPFPLFEAQRSEIDFSTTQHIGIKLMTDHLLALELTALLLLMALVGAAYMVGKNTKRR